MGNHRLLCADVSHGSSGPAPAAAIASARGWYPLVTPGVMCAIFGKSIGTFIGVGVTMLLSR